MDERALELISELPPGGSTAVRVRGSCMTPILHEGDLVTVRRARLYFPGDVVVFRTPAGDLAAHRLLGYRRFRGRLAFVTRGDHCSIHDFPVTSDAMIGVVTATNVSLHDRLSALGALARIIMARLSR